MEPIEQIGDIIRNYDKDGLRFLLLFKMIKDGVQEQLKKNLSKEGDQDIIDMICAEAAWKLLKITRGSPTKEQIEQVLEDLEKKYQAVCHNSKRIARQTG